MAQLSAFLNLVDAEEENLDLVRIELVYVPPNKSGKRVSSPDGSGEFLLKGVDDAGDTILLHRFSEGPEEAGEILSILVDEQGLSMAYKDADREIEIEDLSEFATWLEEEIQTGDDIGDLILLLDSVSDAL